MQRAQTGNIRNALDVENQYGVMAGLAAKRKWPEVGAGDAAIL
jgi:hypothetical protein